MHRLQLAYRSDGPGSPHLKLHIHEAGGRLPCRKFIGNRPTRMVRCKSGLPLQCEVIYFYHQSVNFVRISVSFLLPFFHILQHFIDISAFAHFLYRRAKTQLIEHLHGLEMRVELSPDQVVAPAIFGQSHLIDKSLQPSFSYLFGVLQPQGAGSRIARIGQSRQAFFHAFFVDFSEKRFFHQHLSPDFAAMNSKG